MFKRPTNGWSVSCLVNSAWVWSGLSGLPTRAGVCALVGVLSMRVSGQYAKVGAVGRVGWLGKATTATNVKG